MAVMVNNYGGETECWRLALKELLGDMPVYTFPIKVDPELIQYAVVWHHPHEDLMRYPNLRAVLVLGAGTDHIDQAPELPNVPIVRLVDPAVGDDMAQYVLYWTMHFQRGYETYRQQQKQRHWQRYEYPLARDFEVSILGAGLIGAHIAQRVALMGFKVNSWSRRLRASDEQNSVRAFSGSSGLNDMLPNTRVLVNCLPLNEGTKHFINDSILNKLPEGSHLINVSRGGVVDDAALLKALENGRMASAALDSFSHEPLDKTHAYWSTPNVFVTPHTSGATYPRTAAQVIADNIKRLESGESPFPIYVPPQAGHK